MLKRTLASVSLWRLLLATGLTLLAVDLLPHPSLGPSLTQQVLSKVIQPVTVTESPLDRRLGRQAR